VPLPPPCALPASVVGLGIAFSLHILKQEQSRTLRALESERLATLEALRAQLHRLIPSQPVWVYGSILRPGKFRPDSDIDLALEGDPGIDPLQLAAAISDELHRATDVVQLERTRLAPTIRREAQRWIA
jgi:predicted nucleotidyltransferase